jgi:hypothetical protein
MSIHPTLTKYTRWTTAFFFTLSVILTSANVYPANLVLAIIASAMWIIQALSLNKKASAYQQVALIAIYATGLLAYFIGPQLSLDIPGLNLALAYPLSSIFD